MFTFSEERLNYLFSILEKQVDSFGRYFYKGVYDGFQVKEDQGDMTYHNGILLQILSFSVLKSEYKEFSKKLLRKLSMYFNLVQANSLIGREFLFENEFNSLLPHEKHCRKGTFWGLDSGKVCNKWHINYSNNYIRYDISVDSLLSFLAGVLYIKSNFWLYDSNEKEIVVSFFERVRKLKSYYETNGYIVKDFENGKPCRFGNHYPYLTPMNYLLHYALDLILDKDPKENKIMEWLVNNTRTYLTGVFKDKKERFTYNGYMFAMIVSAINYYLKSKGKPLKFLKGLQNILNEAKGEQNLFFLKIAKYFGLKYDPGIYTIVLDNYIVSGMSFNQKVNQVVNLSHRVYYNRWEKSAYTYSQKLEGQELYFCNEDLLQTYFIFEK
jgi:hypothetical protein